ncbi:MAG TPA: translocation/assembly module TamB domain-containing protein, partial [Kofleriaceae bacterium]
VVDVSELRGGPIDQPIDVHATASLDERATTATVGVGSRGASLVEIEGRLPVSLVDVLARRGQAAGRDTPLEATAKLTSTDAARLLAVFGRTEVTSGRIDGSVTLTGTLGAPKATVRVTASQLTIPPGPHNKPVRVVERLAINGSWDGGTARIDVDGTESGGGALRLAAQVRPDRLRDGTATVKATRFDLVPLLVFAPGPAGGMSGVLDADLRLAGLDLRTAQLAGEIHLRQARIPTAPTIGTLRAATIDALVADHEIRIAADGKLGAGSASLTGTIALDGAAPNGGKARLTLRKVSPIGSIEPQITADVNATLSRDRNQWKAELVVDHGDVVVPSDRGEKLKPAGAPPDMVFADGRRITRRPMTQQEPTNPIFQVKINLRSTRVESKEFRGLIHGQLEMRADGEAIAMYGGIEAERGDLDLFGRRYQVDRAAVNFDGSLDPLLDIRITYDFPEVTTVTEVRGRLSKPDLVMTSDPGTYSQGQLLGFLLGGEPGGDPQSGPLQSQVATAGESLV